MYCVQCGVKLADSEVRCPLCGTRVFHPDILREAGESLYPAQKYPEARKRTFVLQALFTAAFILPFIIPKFPLPFVMFVLLFDELLLLLFPTRHQFLIY